MPRRANPQLQSIPPTLSQQRAITLLRQQVAKLDRISKLPYDDPENKMWLLTTEGILNGAFGKPDGNRHSITSEFMRYHGGPIYAGMSEQEFMQDHIIQIQARKAVLESAIQQLELLAPPATQTAQDQYRFHPEIERVSSDLYRNGHYKQAALEAYIRVIDEVKKRSGLNDDGDPLMNRAFGSDKHVPVIQFNSLQTDAERDEQKGIMFLFKGTVGLRNFKAHRNQLFDDPYRAHDYLALASLLMRLLEIATVNRNP